MNMKKCMMCAVAAVSGTVLASPQVKEGSVSMTQDASRRITVSYVLTGAPAIVTVDFQTNVTGTAEGPWVSIGEGNFRSLSGEVNKLVSTLGTPVSLHWRPNRDWPDRQISGSNIRAVVKAWAKCEPPDYMTVDLEVPNCVRYYVSEQALPRGSVTDRVYKTSKLLLRKIPAANVTWRMGSLKEDWAWGYEAPEDNTTCGYPHYVTLSNDYYIGVFPVTQRQYALIRNAAAPAVADELYPKDHEYPLSLRGNKKWQETGYEVGNSGFFHDLREKAGGGKFDLPTEAQWEYACRAGCGEPLYNGSKLTDLFDCPVIKTLGAVRTAKTSPVGSFVPNNWKLYDMIGNVMEFCLDAWSKDNREVDPEIGLSKYDACCVTRGGGHSRESWKCTCSARVQGYNEFDAGEGSGFRVTCRTIDLP